MGGGFQQYPGQPQYLGGGNFAGGSQGAPVGGGFGGFPGRFNYGPGENPLPGFSARQSPMEAGMRTGFRNMVPGVSLGLDQPEAGSGQNTWWKKLLAGMPMAGRALFGPLFAGMRAAEARDQNEYLYPQPESILNRGMTTIGAGLQYAPGGQGIDLAKNIFSGIQAGRGIADFFGFNPGQAMAGAAGFGARQLGQAMGPFTPSSYPFFGQSPTAGGEWWNPREEQGGVGAGYSTQNWSDSQIPSSFYERG